MLVDKKIAGLDDEARGYLDRVLANVARMGNLIDDLLEFSRLGRRESKTQVVDVTDLLDDVLTDLAPLHQDRPVEITVGEMPGCMADPHLLRQVYTNLLGNAIKFTRGKDPAEIEVGGTRIDDYVRFHVADNGAGFDMRYADKLFGVFQRLHTPDEFEGTGVGLAIVHRIIVRHGGEIWADAELDRGATFYFTLPAAP